MCQGPSLYLEAIASLLEDPVHRHATWRVVAVVAYGFDLAFVLIGIYCDNDVAIDADVGGYPLVILEV